MHKNNKVILLIMIAIMYLFLLSGCSFSDLMSKSTGITNDPDYKTWEKLTENGKLDKDGKYTADAVHVTFAQNSFLDAHYYTDSEKKNELKDGCYLMPGEKIYFSVNTKSESENIYLFDHINVIEYTESNERQNRLDWVSDDGISIMVPYDYKGTEISLEPAGCFGERQLILNAYDVEHNKISGQWYINTKEVQAGTNIVNPLNTYTVEFQYPSNYFIASSNSDIWKVDDVGGRVVFKASEPKTGTETYQVVLDSFASADISVKDGQLINLKHEGYDDTEKIIDAKKGTVSRIRDDSNVFVITDRKDPDNLDISSDLKYTLGRNPTENIVDGMTQYTFKIEFGDRSKYRFIPAEYTDEHGKFRFICNGKEITDATVLDSGMEIYYEAAETGEGYWLPDSGSKIVVSGPETREELNKIRFYPYRIVSVILSQPMAGGHIVYSVDGEEITGDSADLFCGSKISAELKPDSGWSPTVAGKMTYTVTEKNNQVVSFDELQTNPMFIEEDSHKPVIVLKIGGSIEKSKFKVTANGYEKKDLEYSGSIFEPVKVIDENKKIGTDKDIAIIFQKLDFSPDKNAIKVFVTKDSDKGLYSEIHYINKSNVPEYIKFAKEPRYKNVTLNFDAVAAEEFHVIEHPNANIRVIYKDVTHDGSDGDATLRDGMLTTGDRTIEAQITPHEGYMMTGTFTDTNGVYKRIMWVNQYKQFVNEALEKQLVKACKLYLDNNDPYGIVEFKINNQVCAGSVTVPENQKIVIEYKLTNDEYEIVGDSRKEITINSEMDGKHIKRDTWIQVREKVSK